MSAELCEVQTTVADVMHHLDGKRWADLRALYASEVVTDYTSLFGGTPQRQSADALIAGWQANLSHVQTQHLLGPIVVTLRGDRASAACHVRAVHFAANAASGARWEVLGHYQFELTRSEGAWTIAQMTIETFFQLGNSKLLAEA